MEFSSLNKLILILGTDQTPLEVLLESDHERATLMKREKELETIETTESASELNLIYKRLNDINAFDVIYILIMQQCVILK